MKTYRLLSIAVALALNPLVHAQETLEKTVVKSKSTEVETATVRIVDADTIDGELITNIYDTVRYTAGVTVNNTGNRFGDNGFNIRGLEGDSVAITVDGLSQGESLDPITFSRYGMFSATRNAIDPESVKSIKIVKGASSVIAGSGALGGAVMYTTKDAADYLSESGDDFAGTVKLGYDGRNDETLVNVALAKRIGQLEGLLILTKRDGSETKAHSNGDDIEGPGRGQSDPYDSDKLNILAKLNYDFGDNHQLGIVIEDFDNETEGTALSRESSSYYDFYTFDESTRQRVGINYQWQGDNALFDSIDMGLNQQEIYTRGSTFFSYSSGGTAYLRNEDRNFNQELLSFDVDFTKDLTLSDTSHSIVYGVAIEQTEVENQLQDIRYNDLTIESGLRDGYPIIDPSWVPKTSSDIFTLYMTDTIDISELLTFNGGIRYDKRSYSPKVDDTFVDQTGQSISDVEFSAVTWAANFSYEFLPRHTVTAGVSTGFKAPTTHQLYRNTDGTSFFEDSDRVVDTDTGNVSYVSNGRLETDLDSVTNPNLKAETGVNYELEYQYQGDFGYVNASIFQSDYDDFIISLTHTGADFDEAITQASSNWWLSQCSAEVVDDSCWTVEEITADEWTVPTNVGKVIVSGYEIEAGLQLADEFVLTFSHSHTHGEYDNSVDGSVDTSADGQFEKGQKLESVTPDVTILGLDYLQTDGKWGASIHSTFHEAKDRQDYYSATYYSDSAAVVDLSAFYDVTDNLVLRAGITNLFDKQYYQWQAVRLVREGNGGFFGGVTGDGIERFSQPGREFTMTINYSF